MFLSQAQAITFLTNYRTSFSFFLNELIFNNLAGGLGKIMVKEFLKLGCNVVCVDLKQEFLDSLKVELEKELKTEPSMTRRLFYYELDVTSSEGVKVVAQKIKKEVGKVDILINNAGIMNQGKLFLELTEQDVKNIFSVNTFAHFWMCREFLPDMINENKGHIVNVASVCGLVGGYKITDYCSSKFATTGFTESLRAELRVLKSHNNIIVSGVYPFHIKTKLFNGADISCFKWLNLSMEPEFAAATIVHGVLAEKESIFVPKIVYLFACIK